MSLFRRAGTSDLKRSRTVMIERHLKGRDIIDPAVLEVMRTVPREKFIPADLADSAYDDTPLAIGHGQTISQPYIVGYMLQKLRLKKTDKVLEVGTGSGYQAAALSMLAGHVYTVEIIEPLKVEAARKLAQLGYENVTVLRADGSLGCEEFAPYDKIIAAASARRKPERLEDQLAEGGLLIMPVGDDFSQELELGEKRGGKVEYKTLIAVRFVPMTGAAETF